MNKTASIIIAVIVAVLGFYGGMKYDQHKVASAQASRLSQFANAGTARGTRTGGANFGGGISGQIISKDANGITVALTSTSSAATAGSAIVYISASTTISQMTTISPSALAVGQAVFVSGTKDSSGAIKASSIQLRPTR